MTSAPYGTGKQHSSRPTRNTKAAAESKRTLGEDAVPAPGHSTANLPRDFRKVNGWGADLDPANRPSVPREFPSDVMTVRGDVKHWQKPHSKIHVSNEQPGLTPVFGETAPPRGLSGLLRDYAYQFGEATNRHWLTLMMANRVDVMESMLIDAMRGRPDNFIREKGWSAKAKYRGEDNDGFSYMTAGVVVVSAIALGLLIRNATREE